MRILWFIALTLMYHGFALPSQTSHDDARATTSHFNEILARQVTIYSATKYSADHDETLWGNIFETLNDAQLNPDSKFNPNYKINGMPLAQLIFAVHDKTLNNAVLNNSKLDLAVKDSVGNSLLHTMFDRLLGMGDSLKKRIYENWLRRDPNNIVRIIQDQSSSSACQQYGYQLWLNHNGQDIKKLLRKMIQHVGPKDSGDGIRWGLKRLDQSHLNNLIWFAAKYGNGQAIKILYDSGIDMNCRDSDGNSFAHAAAMAGNTEALYVLHKIKKSLLLASNDHDDTPAHCAAEYGQIEAVKALYQMKANINAVNRSKETPAYYAARNGHTEMLKALRQMKANMYAVDCAGETLAHAAATLGHTETLKLLHQWGIDMNAKDSQGQTPVHYAAEDGNIEALMALHKMGANMNLKNMDGLTPALLAKEENNIEAYEALLQMIAKKPRS